MNVLLSGLLALFSGTSFFTAFRSEDLFQPLLLGSAVGALVSWLLTGVLRRGPGLTFLGGVAAVVGAGSLTGSFQAMGLRDGPLTIVQAPAPVPAGSLELTVPYVAVALAAFVGTELAQRSRAATSPVLPSLAVLLAGLVLGGEGQELSLSGPFAWTAAALVLIGWRSRSGSVPDEGRPRRAGGGGVLALAGRGGMLVAVAAVLAVGAGATGHQVLADQDRDRFGLDEPEPPAESEDGYNPLSRVTTLYDGPDEPLYDVETSVPVEQWRLAVLDSYDGASWTSGQSFDTAGRELAPVPAQSAPDADLLEGEPTEVDQVIEVTAEGRRWLGNLLPTVGRPLEVDVDGLLFDVESGSLAVDGEPPDRYGVTSEVVWPDVSLLADADVASDAEARAALELSDDVPEEFEELTGDLTSGIDSAYGRAVALEGYFEAFELVFEEPPSGHSYSHLKSFLFSSDTPRGSPEQFAASYALMARLADLPSRVVVGFHGLGAAGEHSITSYSATAWVEIKFEGLGWVAFDPVPSLATETPPPEEDNLAGSDDPPPDGSDGDEDDELEDEDVSEDGDEDEGGGVPWIVVGALGLVTAAVSVPAVRRAVRRRRQRRGDTNAERIAGAWEAALDVLRTAGLPVGDDLGAFDVVGVSAPRTAELGGESLRALGVLLNQALFAPDPPGDGAASRAWELRDDVAKGHRRSRPRRQALRDYFLGR